MNTKKISELNITENVSENMNMVVEDNGQTKRFPASKIVTSVNGKSGDVVLEPGVQSDWNENDETSLAYVKNRPFYDGIPVETEIVQENTVTFSDSGNLFSAQVLYENFNAIEGQISLISWDNTDYTCTCILVENTIPVIGNTFIAGVGNDTGEPFLFVNIGTGQWQIHTTDTATEHTIGIKQVVAPINQINKKYIPDDAFAQSDWDEQDETNVSFVRNRPIYLGKEVSITVPETTRTILAGTNYIDYTGEISFKAGTSYRVFGKMYTKAANYSNVAKIDEIDMVVLCDTDAKLNINFTGTKPSVGGFGAVIIHDIYDGNHPFYSNKICISDTIGSGLKYTLKFELTVTAIKQINDLLIPESIARKDYIDSRLPSYSSDDYKGTFVVNSDGHLEVQRYNYDYLANRPFYKSTSIKEIASATGIVSSGGYLYMSSDNPGFTSGAEYTVNINGTEEVIVAEYHIVSGEIQLEGSNFRIYPSSSKYTFYSTSYSTIEITISITGPVEEIVKIDTDFIPESIARKDYVDSRLPSYSRDDYKGTFVVNGTGNLEVQRYNWDYLTNKPFGKLEGYEPVAKLSVDDSTQTFTFTSGDKYFANSKYKYWVVCGDGSYYGTGWLATASTHSSYDIYMLYVQTNQYPEALISEFDLSAGTFKYYSDSTGNILTGIPSTIYIYKENEWGTKMMDEAYIPSTIQRVGGDVIIPSSTADSTKKFKITVDDTGEPTFTDTSDSSNSWAPYSPPNDFVLFQKITVEEAAESITFDNVFNDLSGVIVLIKVPAQEESNSSAQIRTYLRKDGNTIDYHFSSGAGCIATSEQTLYGILLNVSGFRLPLYNAESSTSSLSSNIASMYDGIKPWTDADGLIFIPTLIDTIPVGTEITIYVRGGINS